MTYSFSTAGTIIAGAGASNELLPQLRKLGATRVLFVTDAFMESTGIVATLAKPLVEAGMDHVVYSGVQPDPTVYNVEEGLRLMMKHRSEALVAVGGGSSIDAAKAMAIAKTNSAPLSKYMGYHKIPKAGVPLVAIPTTAGTGSEVTKVTVITDTENKVKMMILDDHLLPAVALIDYELTFSMPAPLTAHVGVDTLTHAIEAYVSRKANGLTDPIALSCIGLVSKHLYTAWSEPNNREAREAMSLAACQGGMAFTNSSVCLVHGMSRPLGVQFHLPHGLSNAVLLPTVTRFSVPGAIARYATIARTMQLAQTNDSDEAAAMALVEGLKSLNQKLEVPALRDCQKLNKKKFTEILEKMANDALASGSPQNNPRVPTAGEIVHLYQEAW